jgi:hypothetical protein
VQVQRLGRLRLAGGVTGPIPPTVLGQTLAVVELLDVTVVRVMLVSATLVPATLVSATQVSATLAQLGDRSW